MGERPEKMPDQMRDAMIATQEGWSLTQDGKAMMKQYRFTSFNAAMGFMMRAGLKAEQMDHHPEWCNIYNRVDVTLTTHDVGGLTVLDEKLALAMDKIAESSGLKHERASKQGD